MTTQEAFSLSALNLRRIRESKGFSVPALAVLSGVEEATIIACEKGDFDYPVSVLHDLVATLNVGLDEILVDPTSGA